MRYCSEAGVKANYGLAGDDGSSHGDGNEDVQVVLDSFGFFDFNLFFDFYDFYFPKFLGFSYNNLLYLRSRMAGESGGVTKSR